MCTCLHGYRCAQDALNWDIIVHKHRIPTWIFMHELRMTIMLLPSLLSILLRAGPALTDYTVLHALALSAKLISQMCQSKAFPLLSSLVLLWSGATFF